MKNLYFPTLLIAVLLLLFSTYSAVAGNTPPNPDKQIFIDLMGISNGNTETLLDGMTMRYNVGYLPTTTDDAEKISNTGENIASYREGKDFSVEKRPLFYFTDTVFLHLTNTVIRDYRFKVSTQQFSITGLMIKITDNYLHTSTILNTYGATTNINFSVTADPASADPFRFSIVILTAMPLPVTFTSFAANQQGKHVSLEWKVSNQVNMQQYEVERSANGISYSKVATQMAISTSNSHTYTWVDEHTLTGNNFYRIRCVGITGAISYSTIVNVKMGGNATDINIYPNPVINNTIALQFTGMQRGVYNLILLSSMGQVAFTTSIKHNGGSSTQTVIPPTSIAKGNYYLEITGPGNLKMSKLVTVIK